MVGDNFVFKQPVHREVYSMLFSTLCVAAFEGDWAQCEIPVVEEATEVEIKRDDIPLGMGVADP